MRLLIKIIGLLFKPTAIRFNQALQNPKSVQKLIQKDILKRLLNSEYGRFLGIKSIDDWNRIPIVDYDIIQPWINKQKETDASILTNEPIIFYEKTSGSRSAAKLIPYTKSLRKSFNSMFCVWASDLIQNGISFSTGKIYFSISPQLGEKAETIQGISIGLEDDSDYLDTWLQALLSPFWVSIPGMKRIHSPEEFKEKLCLTLLQEEKLEIISIWNPSFLKVSLDYIQENRIQLYEKLKNKISNKRSQLLLKTEIPWTQLWPHLKLISCWDSANATEQADYLRTQFPGILVQGKGLLATEAPITIPLLKANGCVPILNEVFFEFEDNEGNIYLLHELKEGKEYSIILSQKGGLYRYRMGDRILVTHFYYNTPCLKFLGRTHTTSDLVGEKLHEDFVKEVLDKLQLEGTFFKSLVPVTSPKAHYVLLLDYAKETENAIASRLDSLLSQSYHYNQARLLGQLSPAKVIISPEIPDKVTQYHIDSGKKWGNIKHQLLVTTPIKSVYQIPV
ncbi:MAG: GH3 family domain-containing protein [Halothece sp.]